jgi:hypothetical protein
MAEVASDRCVIVKRVEGGSRVVVIEFTLPRLKDRDAGYCHLTRRLNI